MCTIISEKQVLHVGNITHLPSKTHGVAWPLTFHKLNTSIGLNLSAVN